MPALPTLSAVTFPASLKSLSAGPIQDVTKNIFFSLTQLCQHEFGIAHIFFQGTVDRHFDLHHLHRKRSTPGHQRTAVHLLLPASQACQTHKVRFATAPDGLLYIHIREEKHSRYFDFVSGGCLMRQKRSPGRG